MSGFHLPETEALSQRLFGKAVEELTDDEMRMLVVAFKATIATSRGETSVILAAGDQAEAAIAEAKRCGCFIESKRRPDGSVDLFTCRVVHRPTCRRETSR